MVPTGLDFATEFGALSAGKTREHSVVLGGLVIRLVRLDAASAGDWGRHDHTAETAIVWSGDFTVEFRDATLHLSPGQCCVVAAGADHRGSTRGGAEIILLTAA